MSRDWEQSAILMDLPIISYDEANMLQYFHGEKGDVTRWIGWDEVAQKYPIIKKHYEDYIARTSYAEKCFNDIINKLYETSEGER